MSTVTAGELAVASI